ncbi:MAG: response regulator transcription factor [Coriobacteriia bacterium]
MGAPAGAKETYPEGLPRTGFRGDIARMLKPRFLCMGFLWAWIYCLWFTPAVFPGRAGVGVNADSSWLISLVGVTLALLLTPLVVPKERQLSSFRSMLITAPAITAIGTFFIAINSLGLIQLPLLSQIGAAITGFGSGWLWIMIGEFYSRLDPDYVEIFAPASAFVIVAAIIPISAMSGIVASISVSLLPVISAVLLVLALSDESVSPPVPVRAAAETPDFWPYFIRVGLGSMVTYTALGFLWSRVNSTGLASVGQGFQMPFLIGALFAGAFALYSIYYSRRLDILTLYRWMPPFLVIALALSTLAASWAQALAYISATIAQLGFDIMIWIFFTDVAHKGIKTPAIALGMSRGFVQVGVTIGSALGIVSDRWLHAGAVRPTTVVLVLICMLAIATSFMQERRELARAKADEAIAPTVKQTGENPEYAERSEQVSSAGIDEICGELAERHGLSPREREVLGYLARGRSLPYIREQLVLSKNTIDTHAKNLYRKLDVHSRQELIDLIDRVMSERKATG